MLLVLTITVREIINSCIRNLKSMPIVDIQQDHLSKREYIFSYFLDLVFWKKNLGTLFVLCDKRI